MALQQAFMRMSDINNSNFQIMAMMLARLEVLKDKGMFTDEETKIKFDELEAAKETNAKRKLEAERALLVAAKETELDKDKGSVAGGSLQSETAGNNENNLGGPKLTVLPSEGDGRDSGSTGDKE